MELLLELFMTAVLALVFSYVVAKLVSIAMTGDHDFDSAVKSNKTVTPVTEEERHEGGKSDRVVKKETIAVVEQEEVKFDRGLQVEGTRSERKVQFAVEEVSGKVDEFVVERLSVGRDDQIDAVAEEAPEVVGLSVELPEVGIAAATEEEVVGVGGGIESKGVEGGDCREEIVSAKDEPPCVVEVPGLEEGNNNNDVEELNAGLDELVVEDTNIANEKDDDGEVGVQLLRDDKIGEDHGSGGVGLGQDERVEEEEGLGSGHEDDDDDWEGIERSEMEKIFATAAEYVDLGGKDDWFSNLGTDVQMQLYGLHKVAMEGPCRDPQPMALKFSARAKWNAWQRLGNMSPQVAMEQYISLLSDKVPWWTKAENGKSDLSEIAQLDAPDHIMDQSPDTQPYSEKEGKLELKLSAEGGDLTRGSKSKSVNKDKE